MVDGIAEMEGALLSLFSLSLATVLVSQSQADVGRIDFVPAGPQTVNEYQSVWVYCNVSWPASSQLRVTWVKEENSSHVLTRNANLTFPRITRKDAGRYMCNANVSNTTWSNVTTVYVRYPPGIEISSNQTVNESTSVVLFCNSTGYPEPNVIWRLPNGTTRAVISLTVCNVHRSATGKYTCEATNEVGIVRSHTFVNVQYPPGVVMPSSMIVNESSEFTLVCNATGNPLPSIIWILPNDTIVSGSLVIKSMRRTYGGNYTCIASNGIGKKARKITFIVVHYPPKINRTGASIKRNSWLHDVINLTCRTSGNPTPEVAWYKNGSRKSNPTVSTLSMLTITVTSEDQFGNYTCEASNYLGSDKYNIYLNRSRFSPLAPVITNNDTTLITTNLRLTWARPNSRGSNITSYSVWRTLIFENGTTEGWRKFRQNILSLDCNMTLRREVIHGFAISAKNRQGCSGRGESKNFTVTVAPTSERSTIDLIIILSVIGGIVFLILLIVFIVLCAKRSRVPEPIRKPGSCVIDMTELNAYFNRSNVTVQSQEDNISEDVPDCYRRAYGSPSGSSSAVPTYANVNSVCLDDTSQHWEVLRENVCVEKVIGKGAFCQVAKAFVVGLGTVAVKMLRDKSSDANRKDLLAEYELLKGLGSHDNIVNLFGAVTVTGCLKMKDAYSYEPGQIIKHCQEPLPGVSIFHTSIMQGDYGTEHYHEVYTGVLLSSAEQNGVSVDRDDPIMVLFEYIPYGDLLGYLRRSRGLRDTYYKNPDVQPSSSLTSEQLLRFAKETADGMAFLASNKIIHRDLAARNVLVGQGEICKITDFGMARDVLQNDIYQKRTRGRLPVKWTAYESLLYGLYTTQSDVWSYGVVLYEIFTIGGCPYPSQSGHHIADILQNGYRMPKPKHVDDEIYALMMECWRTEPERRPTFEAISSTLQRLQLFHKEYIYMNEYDGTLYANLDDL